MSSQHEELKYFSLDPILKLNADYNIIFGERSNGKTFACLYYALEQYVTSGKQAAYIRRYKEDYRGSRGTQLYQSLVSENKISELTLGMYNNVYYYSGRWYLANYDSDLDKMVHDENPFMFAFALSDVEHDKSTSFPKITTIIFDEFLTRQFYMTDEFVIFMNTVSTIVRHRSDVKIFMLGNTVNKYCPYFKEMGLNGVFNQKQGTIDVYTNQINGLKIAVEYADSPNRAKPSDKYFAFENTRMDMIKSGVWEMAMYPHCPMKFTKDDIMFTYFIDFNDSLLQCEIISKDNTMFTYIHEKTTPLQDESKDLIYSDKYDPRPNHRRNIRKSSSPLERKVGKFFAEEKVYFQNNEVGEVVRNYLAFCLKETGYLKA